MASENLKYMTVPEKIELANPGSGGYQAAVSEHAYKPMKVSLQ